jgi:cell division protein FtsB
VLRKKNFRKKIIIKNRMMAFLCILIVGVLFLLSNEMGIVRWYQLHNERNLVQIEIDHLIEKEKELTNELDRLTNDKEYIKNIAQEKFHMVKPGEKVFRVIDRRKIK